MSSNKSLWINFYTYNGDSLTKEIVQAAKKEMGISLRKFPVQDDDPLSKDDAEKIKALNKKFREDHATYGSTVRASNKPDIIRAYCTHCFSDVRSNSISLKLHLVDGCKYCPQELQSLYVDDVMKSSSISSKRKSEISVEFLREMNETNNSWKKKSRQTKFFKQSNLKLERYKRCTEADIKYIDSELSKFFYSTGSPLSGIQNIHLHNALDRLNGSYNSKLQSSMVN
jgi:hypothetical protein